MGANGTPGRRAIVIAGPTASGKSALALALAERLGGAVVNADSMQVYRDLRILTARPSDAELDRAPHRLFGHVDAAETYSVGRWLDEVAAVLEELRAENRVPIIVGGTGLYLQALTQGLSAIPQVPPEIRNRVRFEAEGRPPGDLHAELARADPTMAARLRPGDPQRIIRALEVLAATGRSLATFQQSRAAPLLPAASVAAVRLVADRAALGDAIDRRFDGMMDVGGLAEVQRLAARTLDPALPAMRALGIPPLLAHLRGDLSLTQAIVRSKLLTRQYAKRQLTFARHQLPSFEPLPRGEALSWLSARAG